MGRLIVRRVSLAIPTLFVVATLTFFMIHLVPGNPASFLVGVGATKAQVAYIDHQLGLDKPLLDQYVTWLSHVLHGNLGTSDVTQQPVTRELATAIPVTLSLSLLGTLGALVVGMVLGVTAALRGGWADRVAEWLAGLGLGIPNFWLAALLVYLFAIKVAIFPATGYTSITSSVSGWFIALILPAAALAANSMAQVVLQARSGTLEALASPFVRTLQAAGIPRRRIVLRHVLRNASIPIITVTGFLFVTSLGGVVVIESIFNLQGFGSVFLTAVQQDDLPTVQGGILYFTLAVMIVNLLADLAVAWVDPRVQHR